MITCNCCKKEFEVMVEDKVCPNCFSLPRHRALLQLLKMLDIFKKPCKLLHFAPEDCLSDIFKSYSYIDYVTTELTGDVTIRMDITDILFKDNVFDYIICNHVLEHIEDDKKAISEMTRVLKPSGLMFITIPQDFTRENTYEDKTIKSLSGRKKAFGQHDHVRIYGRDFIARLGGFTKLYYREQDEIYICEK